MPNFHSIRQIRRDLAKSIPNRAKREFMAGYIEGHAAKFGSGQMISPARLDQALKKLERNPGIGMAQGFRLKTEDVSKLRNQIQWGKEPPKEAKP